MNKFLPAFLTLVVLSGCMTAAEHRQSLGNESTDKLTVGTVQKEIKKGMSGGEVAAALGSPNIVTSDRDGNETWIYDKLSTEFAYSNSSGDAGSLVLGFGTAIAGAIGGSLSSNSGASSRTQKTLTIIIKFVEGKVDEYSYRSSSF